MPHIQTVRGPIAPEALGVTRQAVHKKHAKRLKALGIEARRR